MNEAAVIVYKRQDLWFWTCPVCHWVEGAFGSFAAAEKDSLTHECRRAS